MGLSFIDEADKRAKRRTCVRNLNFARSPTAISLRLCVLDEALGPAPIPARVAGASVTFEPGARTAWHTHPLGQTLIVTSGVGRAQRWGGPVEEIRPGDVVWFVY